MVTAMAGESQPISATAVRRIWKTHGLQPHRYRQFKLSNDPKFGDKLLDVVGLYVNPPAHAIVFSFDEKSQIEALDRTQPGLPLKKGRLCTMTHDYKRNGTTTLFGALNVFGVLGGAWGWTLFGLVWGIALIGIIAKTTLGFRFPVSSVLLYLGMGWLGVIAAKPLMQSLTPHELTWIVAGGLAYTAGVPIAFGHWSTLGLVSRPDLLALDTGCVWGGCLTAARLGDGGSSVELISVRCEQAARPGKG